MKRKNVIIDKTVILGKGVEIQENVEILGTCKIGDYTIIKSGCRLKDTNLGNNCILDGAIIEKSEIGNNCSIGPFTHIRPNSILQDNIKVGSFVEIKNSKIGKGTKVPHLSYVGDAEIGENCNIGCGVVFANYNGKIKQRSTIGNNVFIGCNVNIVAPVNIADDTYICAGTTVTDDTEQGNFVIGRVHQQNKPKRKNDENEDE